MSGPRGEVQRRLLAAEGTFQLLSHLGRRGGGAATARGVVACLDDLQWADLESLEVVHHLATVAADSGLVLVCTVRSSERSPAEELARRLARQGDAEVLELRPLAIEQLATLVGELLGAPAPAALVVDVSERSVGLPLFVEEIVHEYRQAGRLAVRDGTVAWSGPAHGLLPPTMTSWVESRLARLDDQARAVVAAAAVLDRFDQSLVEVAEVTSAVAEQALRSATEAGLIDRDAGGPRFRHDLVRDAVVGLVAPFRIAALHRRADEVLARHAGAPEERARHLEAVGANREAAALLVDAARRGLEVGALHSAEEFATRALELAPGWDRGGDARELLAASLAAQGRWTDALAMDREAVVAGRLDASIVARMVDSALQAGQVAEAASLLSSTPADLLAPARRGRLRAAVMLASGELESAADVAEIACHDALAANAIADACASLDVLGRTLDLLGRHDEAARAFAQWVTLADRAGLRSSKLNALASLGGHQLQQGLPATELLWEARHLGLEIGAYLQLGWVELNLAYAVQFTRPAAEAIVLVEEAVARARRFRLDILAHLLVAAAGAYFPLDAEAAEHRLSEALTLRHGDDDLALIVRYGRGLWAFFDGRYDDAATHWHQCVEQMRTHRGGTPNDAPAALPLALLAAGRKGEAAEGLLAAKRYPVRLHTFPALTALADALLDDRVDRVVPCLEPLRTSEPFLRAGVLVAAAGCCPDQVADSWLREALDQFTWGGWERAASRVRRLMRSRGAPVPRAPRSAEDLPVVLRAHGITAREADILPLVASGMTNRDIADDLYLSIRTVESHISSLLTKLAARNRTDLATRYHELRRHQEHPP